MIFFSSRRLLLPACNEEDRTRKGTNHFFYFILLVFQWLKVLTPKRFYCQSRDWLQSIGVWFHRQKSNSFTFTIDFHHFLFRTIITYCDIFWVSNQNHDDFIFNQSNEELVHTLDYPYHTILSYPCVQNSRFFILLLLSWDRRNVFSLMWLSLKRIVLKRRKGYFLWLFFVVKLSVLLKRNVV